MKTMRYALAAAGIWWAASALPAVALAQAQDVGLAPCGAILIWTG
jgi:hypothetical protein